MNENKKGPTFNNSEVGVFIQGGKIENFVMGNMTVNNVTHRSENNVRERKLEILNRIKIPNPFGT